MWILSYDHLRSLSLLCFYGKMLFLGLPARREPFPQVLRALIMLRLVLQLFKFISVFLIKLQGPESWVQYRAHPQGCNRLSIEVICQVKFNLLSVNLKRATFRMRTEWEPKQNWKWHHEKQTSPCSWTLILDVKNEQTRNVHFLLKPDGQH